MMLKQVVLVVRAHRHRLVRRVLCNIGSRLSSTETGSESVNKQRDAGIWGLLGKLGVVALVVVLSAGCGAGGDAVSVGEKNPEVGESKTPQAVILTTAVLEATLPDESSVPEIVSMSRARKAWDGTDTETCMQDWVAQLCSKALATGLAGFTNLKDQELSIYMASLPNEKTADGLVNEEGRTGDLGKNPPGDEIDVFSLGSPDLTEGWTGQGITVRQGAVVARIEHTWENGTYIPSGMHKAVEKMVVERIQQAQRGENPTASVQ